jgi:hypothetical protein
MTNVASINAQSFSNSFEGVLEVVRQSRGSSIFMFYGIFMTNFKVFEGIHEVPPHTPLVYISTAVVPNLFLSCGTLKTRKNFYKSTNLAFLYRFQKIDSMVG